MPSVAMMNENSPIGARLMPPLMEVSRSCPHIIIPMVANMSLNTTAMIAIGTIEVQRAAMTDGSTIMPTERKNTAPNMSFTPRVTCSMCPECFVPAISEPAINAPSSIENPSRCATRAIKKQNPIDSTVSISSVMNSVILLRTVGRIYIPSRSHITR